MTSFEKKASNRQNAAQSTGPKTAAGKRNVKLNALRHGFYAQELTVSEPDRRDFEILRESLRAQLAPRTALQEIGLEQIVRCCWRSKLAIRLEMHRLKTQFTSNGEPQSHETAEQQDIRVTQWYGASPADLRNGIRLILNLRNDVSENGPLHLEAMKDEICKAFGVGFYDALMEWKPMEIGAIHAAEFLTKHERNFKLPLPPPLAPPEGTKIVVDPKQKQQMLLKLIDLQAQHLLDLRKIKLEDSKQTAPSDFAPRYFTTASHDLRRAVDWYLYLTSNGL